jgi:centromeric protein E
MAGQTVLQDVLRGFNGTILAYGQTGSGKTHTMQGSQQEPGLIPRCLESLFEALSARENADSTVTVAVSFYEIYLEQIYDLLEPQTVRSVDFYSLHPKGVNHSITAEA